MPRKPRTVGENCTYHVTSRGNDRAGIFLDDSDREWFLHRLFRSADIHRWRVHAYCLMPNHLHICVTTLDPTLPQGMRDLLGPYARRFNWRHKLADHRFGARYWSGEITTDAYLMSTIRYIARNPVRAGLVAHADEWRWSSYTQLLQGDNPPKDAGLRETLGIFHRNPRYARIALRAFIEDPDDGEETPPCLRTSPSLATLFGVLEPHVAARSAHALGYERDAIMQAAGISRSTLARWLRSDAEAA